LILVEKKKKKRERKEKKCFIDLLYGALFLTTCFFIYKHNVYKHTEPDFWLKITHMLSITPALISIMD